MATREEIMSSLEVVIDPELRRSIVELGMVRSIDIADDGAVAVTVSLTTPGCPIKGHFEQAVAEAAGGVEGVSSVSVGCTCCLTTSMPLASANASTPFRPSSPYSPSKKMAPILSPSARSPSSSRYCSVLYCSWAYVAPVSTRLGLSSSAEDQDTSWANVPSFSRRGLSAAVIGDPRSSLNAATSSTTPRYCVTAFWTS